jgi:hypothetical protein
MSLRYWRTLIFMLVLGTCGLAVWADEAMHDKPRMPARRAEPFPVVAAEDESTVDCPVPTSLDDVPSPRPAVPPPVDLDPPVNEQQSGPEKPV